jgi:acyl-coenzyme A thioesterase PaaI-like protein
LTDTLELEFKKELTNHLGSIHAGALYTLAEIQSGLFLQERFKEYKNTLPILRGGEIKYKKEAKATVSAIAKANKESLEKFENTLNKRAKALISVEVELYSNSELVANAKFSWFVKILNLE